MGDGVKYQSQIGRPTIATQYEEDQMAVQTYPLTDDLSRIIELEVSPDWQQTSRLMLMQIEFL